MPTHSPTYGPSAWDTKSVRDQEAAPLRIIPAAITHPRKHTSAARVVEQSSVWRCPDEFDLASYHTFELRNSNSIALVILVGDLAVSATRQQSRDEILQTWPSVILTQTTLDSRR